MFFQSIGGFFLYVFNVKM